LYSKKKELVRTFFGRHHHAQNAGRAGMAWKSSLFMKRGDVCEVETEGIGIQRNRVQDE
jgi:2-keto-4-pentenoate hydratase/2-oxohepta-3-ene-1,7-dioic acid hydratase in catechol pathway